MELSRQASEALGRMIVSAQVFFLRVDPSGRVLETNPFTAGFLGFDPCGRHLDEIFLLFGSSMDPGELRLEPQKKRTYSVPTVHGLPETLCITAVPEGDDTLMVGMGDLDETARLRKELISANNSLSVLTRELQKKNLQLEELNALKNQFLGMAAHDLRKPVSAILNYSEFLIDEAKAFLSEEHFGFLRTIHASTDLMRRIIDDFLDVAMIEAGVFHLEKTQAVISGVVRRSVALMDLPARKRSVKIELAEEGLLPPVEMDEAKIEQVLNNLISNAVEHSLEGGVVRITISASGDEIRLCVKDSGPGISAEDMKRLFTIYGRGKGRKAPGSRSAGLGLAISKKIIEAHGGRIWAQSAPQEGACFCFTLPLKPKACS